MNKPGIPIKDNHIDTEVYICNGLHKGRSGYLHRICEKKCWVRLDGEEKDRCFSIKNVSGKQPINFWVVDSLTSIVKDVFLKKNLSFN